EASPGALIYVRRIVLLRSHRFGYRRVALGWACDGVGRAIAAAVDRGSSGLLDGRGRSVNVWGRELRIVVGQYGSRACIAIRLGRRFLHWCADSHGGESLHCTVHGHCA